MRALPGVTVENRWVPEDEIGTLIAWSDVLVLPYREASRSGVVPAAIAAGRFVVSTRVGGLVEQLDGEAAGTLCEPDASSLAAALRGIFLLLRTSGQTWRRRIPDWHGATRPSSCWARSCCAASCAIQRGPAESGGNQRQQSPIAQIRDQPGAAAANRMSGCPSACRSAAGVQQYVFFFFFFLSTHSSYCSLRSQPD